MKMLSLIKNSILNKWDLKEIEEFSDVKVLMQYINSKYIGSPSLLSDCLKSMKDAKDPWAKKVSINNIQLV